MELKKQTQFLAKFLRDKAIGSPKEACKYAIDHYESINGAISKHDLVNNFSKILASVIVYQKELFQEKIKEVEGQWNQHLAELDSEDRLKIPDYIQASMEMNEIIDSADDIETKKSKIIKLVSPLQSSLSFSNKQSAKSRAGDAFEGHLENFFHRLGFHFDVQETIDGEKFDFIFPSINRFKSFPNDCLLAEAQTTFKDRFRLTQGKATNIQTNKYSFCASGCGVISPSDTADFSQDKLDELQSKGVTLIVFKEAQERINHPIMMSFERFVNTEYPAQEIKWEL